MASLIEIMRAAAKQGGWWAGGTAAASSSTANVVITELTDSLATARRFKGDFIYRGSAAAPADKIRRVASFTNTDGTLTHSGAAYTNQPDGETVDIFGLMPPHDFAGWDMTWKDCVNAALNKIWYIAEDTSLVGLTGSQDTFSLSAFAGLQNAGQVRSVNYRTVRSTDPITIYGFQDMNVGGSWWQVDEDSLTLRLFPPPTTNETVVISYARRYSALTLDADTTTCPLDIAWKGTLSEVYERLNERHAGKFSAEHARSLRAFNEAYEIVRPTDLVLV